MRRKTLTVTEQLDALHQAVTHANARHREAYLYKNQADALVAELTERILDARSHDDNALAETLSHERDLAERDVVEATETLEGKRRAQHRAEQERAAYAAENLDALIGEMKPDAA